MRRPGVCMRVKEIKAVAVAAVELRVVAVEQSASTASVERIGRPSARSLGSATVSARAIARTETGALTRMVSRVLVLEDRGVGRVGVGGSGSGYS